MPTIHCGKCSAMLIGSTCYSEHQMLKERKAGLASLLAGVWGLTLYPRHFNCSLHEKRQGVGWGKAAQVGSETNSWDFLWHKLFLWRAQNHIRLQAGCREIGKEKTDTFLNGSFQNNAFLSVYCQWEGTKQERGKERIWKIFSCKEHVLMGLL